MIGRVDSALTEPLRLFYSGAALPGIQGLSCRITVLGGMVFEGRIMDPYVDRAREAVHFTVILPSGQFIQLRWLARSGTVVVVDSTTGLTNHHVVSVEVG